MKILLTKEIREADLFTIKHEPIKSIDLMERAAEKCTEWICKNVNFSDGVTIFCGQGNNGGDGLAIARLLSIYTKKIQVYISDISENYSADFQTNFNRLNKIKAVKITALSTSKKLPVIPQNSIIIDALFGTGLNKPLEKKSAELVTHINSSNNIKISIDIPSGLFGEDNSQNNFDTIIKANYTLTFHCPKLSFLFEENQKYIGNLCVLDIHLHRDYELIAQSKYEIIDKEDISKSVKKRYKFAHKGNFGHALLIAGSKGKMGAAILSSKACLKSGVGLLTTHIANCGSQILQTAIPEAMISIDGSNDFFSDIPDLKPYSAIGIGPGIGKEKETLLAFDSLLKYSNQNIVIDADGINLISENNKLLLYLKKRSIITPHVGEFDRLVGKSDNSYERLIKQIDFAKKHQIIIVLKGANTSIATPDGQVFFNPTGNPGMATAGSGDVLTGIILSLLAQGYSLINAAKTGVYIHGIAGDLALEKESEESLISSDIIKNLGNAFKYIKNEK